MRLSLKCINAFGDVHTFLLNPDLPHTTTRKILEVFDNPGVCRKFKMELAMTVDAMEPFVKITYILEGDGPLALETYERVHTLSVGITAEHFPSSCAIRQMYMNKCT